MAKYRVVRAWHGVKVGQIVDLERVHPALRANVVPAGEVDSEQAGAAAKVLEDAHAEAAAIVEAAKAEAQRITEQAGAAAADLAGGQPGGELTPATPGATANKPAKGEVTKRLKALEIEFDGRKSAEELAELLPDGDPLKVK